MILEGRKGLLTKDVLQSISHHLSGRSDCKDIEYIVDIHPSENLEYDEIYVSPYITVLPGIHDRKSSAKRGIAYHVIYYHFPEIFENSTQATVHISKNSLVNGKFKYWKYSPISRRRWIRLD